MFQHFKTANNITKAGAQVLEETETAVLGPVEKNGPIKKWA
jgi:hypothetical protein